MSKRFGQNAGFVAKTSRQRTEEIKMKPALRFGQAETLAANQIRQNAKITAFLFLRT
jgi:hypothetical protein